MAIAKPGNVDSHGAEVMYSRPSAIMTPHSGIGACTPSPRNPREEPARMHSTMSDIAKTMAGVNDIGQQVAGHDAQIAVAEGLGRQHVFQVLGDQHFAAHELGVGNPSHNAERDIHITHPRTQDGKDGNDQHVEGESHADIHQPHQQRVNHAAIIAGDGADDYAKDERKRDADEADLQVDTCAIEDAGQDIASEFVGSQPMVRIGRLQSRRVISPDGVIGCQRRPKNGERKKIRVTNVVADDQRGIALDETGRRRVDRAWPSKCSFVLQ